MEKGNNMIFKLNTLFKRDSNGKIREHTIEYTRDGVLPSGYRTVAGVQGGKMVTSEWKLTTGKNIGKVNETTKDEQAEKEAIAKWTINRDGDYFEYITEIGSDDKFKPMLADDYTKRPQEHGHSQPKLDGIRCIARKDGLYFRSGKKIQSCDHISKDLMTFFEDNPNIVLDGELYNHEMKADFNKITSLVRKIKPTEEEANECVDKVQYHIYDLFDLDNPKLPFTERFDIITYDLMNNYKSNEGVGLHLVATVEAVKTTYCSDQDALDDCYSDYTELGYEGQMVRNDTPYENKRSKNLLKRKEFITEEFIVVEVLEGQGNWAGYAKHFELELGDGRNFRSGVRGNQETLKELLEQDVKPTWVTCRYFEKTPDGVPRFPVVIDWGVGERTD